MRNKIKRGNALLYNGNQEDYSAVSGQGTYETQRETCGVRLVTSGQEIGSFVVQVPRGDGHGIDDRAPNAML